MVLKSESDSKRLFNIENRVIRPFRSLFECFQLEVPEQSRPNRAPLAKHNHVDN